MQCSNCTAEKLIGLAFETSDLCDGPMDGEIIANGDLVVSFQGICHAILAAKIMRNEYTPDQLHLRPAAYTHAAVIDLAEHGSDLSQSA